MSSVVLLSGGIDSAVALAQARIVTKVFEGVVEDTLTIDYGQTHSREIDAARAVADYYGVHNTVVTVDPVLFSGSSLTGSGDIPTRHANEPDATYVPARNTVLIALAAARAEVLGARFIVIGANRDDEAGYPDCRRDYIESFRDVLQQGTVGHVWLHAPLLNMSKREIVNTARRLDVPLHLTWSCYRGGDAPCNACGACESRNEALTLENHV